MQNYKKFKDFLFPLLKKLFKNVVIKTILFKFLGSAVSGGVLGWLIKNVVEYVFEDFVKPLLQYLTRKGFLEYDFVKGEMRATNVEKSEREGNEEDYWNYIGGA